MGISSACRHCQHPVVAVLAPMQISYILMKEGERGGDPRGREKEREGEREESERVGVGHGNLHLHSCMHV